MATLIRDEELEKQLREQRSAWGGDRYDEVWDGVYVMAALPTDEHQDLVSGFNCALYDAIQAEGLGRVRPGVNVSDRKFDWKENYRCPDVVVFLNNTSAVNMETHWFGGPDFAIEVISPNDEARLKLAFYASVRVRELLIVDRFPWKLELYRLDAGELRLVEVVEPDDGKCISSQVLPITLKLYADEDRPAIEVVHGETGKKWLV